MSAWIAAKVEMRGTSEGGRLTAFVAGGVYRPQLHFSDVRKSTSFIVQTIADGSQVAPGETATCEGWLLMPDALGQPVEPGAMFVLNEGAREVGSGVILSIRDVAQ